MATILNRQVTFATNGTVTAAGLHNLIDQTEIYAGIITTQDQIASVGSSDQLLIADADETSTSAPRRVTVGSMFNDALNNGIYTTGSFTNKVTAGSFVGNLTGNVTGTIVGTSGTLAGFNSTTGTIVGLNSTTGTIVTGTVSTLNSTTGTITTLNSTTSTITNLAATTSTFLGTITGSTNVVNIGSGQIYKDGSGNVYFGATSKPVSVSVASVQVVGSIASVSNSAYSPQIQLFGANAIAGSAPYVLFNRSKGSYSSPTTVSSGDNIGNLFYGGHDGTSYVNSSGIASFVDGAVSTGTVPSSLSFQTGSVSPTERMRIDSSGNVGIGKTPTNKLDILASANTGITISNGTMTGLFANSADTSIVVGSQTSHAVNFYTNNLPRMTLDSSGNAGIGTTSPSATLHSVSTSASTAAGMFQVTATSSTAIPAISVIKQDSLNTTNQTFVQFNIAAGATGSGKINANGANAAAFGTFSDSRLKENITALPSQIDNVCALKPCEFDYKDGSGHQIGFIAQEMQHIYPDSVGVGDNGMLTITAWSKTEARLVKAIQELKAKNDLLEARLEALEAK
jgi:hypothetical protein